MSDTAEPFALVMQEDIQDAPKQAPWEGGTTRATFWTISAAR